jgi:hypothetical protein
MSFDILLLKPTNPAVQDLSEVEDVSSMGESYHVAGLLEAAFPGCVSGAHIQKEEYAIEAMLGGDPAESVHLTLRFGSHWKESSEAALQSILGPLCTSQGWVAFSVSDNSLFSPRS